MLKEFEKRLLSSFILIPIAIFFIFQDSIYFVSFLSLVFLVTVYEWSKMIKKNNFLKIFGTIFLFFSFYSAFYLRQIYGANTFLFILIICIFTDLGGYVFGKILKGPKLTKISPNKTYAGVVGSFLFSLIAGLVFLKYYLFLYFQIDFAILMILLISLISQIGDLVISYFKRKAKLKDTGKILPGHGGLLDRIDGLIFVLPSIYFLQLIL